MPSIWDEGRPLTLADVRRSPELERAIMMFMNQQPWPPRRPAPDANDPRAAQSETSGGEAPSRAFNLNARMTNAIEMVNRMRERHRIYQFLPSMMLLWGQEALGTMRGRHVSFEEWYDFLDSDEEFPAEAWYEIAQAEYDGGWGREEHEAILEDMMECMDAFIMVRPQPVSDTVRKNCRSILSGRRKYLYDEKRLETTTERTERIAARRARQEEDRQAKAAERERRAAERQASSNQAS